MRRSLGLALFLMCGCTGSTGSAPYYPSVAYFGINVDLGSHAEQQSSAPLSHSVLLVVSRELMTCPERMSYFDNVQGALRKQGVDFLHLSPLDGLTPGSTQFIGFSFDGSAETAQPVNGSVDLTSVTAQNLPTRSEANFGSLGFPRISGSITGIVSTTSDEWFNNQPFTAQHCSGFDGVVGE